jgi:hypothetical protein
MIAMAPELRITAAPELRIALAFRSEDRPDAFRIRNNCKQIKGPRS